MRTRQPRVHVAEAGDLGRGLLQPGPSGGQTAGQRVEVGVDHLRMACHRALQVRGPRRGELLRRRKLRLDCGRRRARRLPLPFGAVDHSARRLHGSGNGRRRVLAGSRTPRTALRPPAVRRARRPSRRPEPAGPRGRSRGRPARPPAPSGRAPAASRTWPAPRRGRWRGGDLGPGLGVGRRDRASGGRRLSGTDVRLGLLDRRGGAGQRLALLTEGGASGRRSTDRARPA